MANILWIVNKYIDGKKDEKFFPVFLKSIQEKLNEKGHQLTFVFFSKMFNESVLTQNNFFYDEIRSSNLTSLDIQIEAERIEKEYGFTFKQAYFPDIIQTSRNVRKISVSEEKLNNLDHLIGRFLFLEDLVLSQGINVIFSDGSPEAEMEFGRAIGYKHKKMVLKSSEGSAFGRSVFLQQFEFGKERLVEALHNLDFKYIDAENFCEDFIKNKRAPYAFAQKYSEKYSLKTKFLNKLKSKDFLSFISWFFRYPFYQLFNFYLWMEGAFIKPIILDKYDPKLPNIFLGFHLNLESTMVLRSMPYVNQTVLVEMISRVLPYGYVLYIREHPHWPKTFSAAYLLKAKQFPNVRLISSKISIHEIIQNSSGILTYNATTGIESLIYGRPVLSFAPNIYYKHHVAVDFCANLFELGAKLSELINKKVAKENTYSYIHKLMQVSNELGEIGSYSILSDTDAINKAEIFTRHFIAAIDWCKNTK